MLRARQLNTAMTHMEVGLFHPFSAIYVDARRGHSDLCTCGMQGVCYTD